jgi:glycosyltransferase involved in cell wall biosynthesis
MVGTGELLEPTKSATQNDKRIHFLGFKNQTELREIYKGADCILLTSNFLETWGLVINEAFSLSVPAIVSNSCGCSEDLVIHGKNGYIYPEGDISKLSRYLESFHSNKGNLMGKFKDSIKTVNHEFSYEMNQKAVSEFLDS